MSVEKNSNLNTHCDLQPNFQNVFKNIPPNKRHNFFFFGIDASYRPIEKG